MAVVRSPIPSGGQGGRPSDNDPTGKAGSRVFAIAKLIPYAVAAGDGQVRARVGQAMPDPLNY